MKQEQYNECNFIKADCLKTDVLEQMLESAYPKESVSEAAKIRLQNRIACQKVMETEQVSFWWLPATVATTISFAIAVFFCLAYAIVNMIGAHSWMPNFMQFVSEIWLNVNLMVLGVEVLISWMITILGVWKGNLVKSARIM